MFASSTPTLTHVFRVANNTKRPVKIKDETHSCDCTTVELSKRELLPGESASLTVSIHVPPTYVKKVVNATLRTDDPDQPDWQYALGFEAFPDARIVPQAIDLGWHDVADMLASESAEGVAASEAWLEVFTPPNCEVRSQPKLVRIPAECIIAMAPEPEVITLGTGVRFGRYRLSVRLKGGACSTGTFVRPLNAAVDPERGTSASITWSVRAPLVCAPERIHFGSVAAENRPTKRIVVLSSNDGLPFRIMAVEHDAFLTVRPSDEGSFPSIVSGRQVIEVVIKVPRQGASRFMVGAVRIRTDRKDYPEVSLQWSAIIRAGGAKSPLREGDKPDFGS